LGVLNSNTISLIKEYSKEQSISNTKTRLYPYLFDERLYIVNATNKRQDVTISHTKQHSFLKIKRIIKELRSKQYPILQPEVSMKVYKNFSLNEKENRTKPLILHSMMRILDIIAANIEQNYPNNISSNKLSQYSSIHGALANMEYNWQSYGSIYQGVVPSMIHPEIIIRILRTIIFDVTFIHFFRELLYHSSFNNRLREDIFNIHKINPLGILLFNWYILEYEKFFFVQMPRFLFHQDSLKKDTNNDLSIVQKMSILDSSLVKKKKIE
jgi:hypothetical protein